MFYKNYLIYNNFYSVFILIYIFLNYEISSFKVLYRYSYILFNKIVKLSCQRSIFNLFLYLIIFS